jgi:threonine dehydrogenase-like Zn-dependent dehydrogenase
MRKEMMTAAVFERIGVLSVKEVPVPKIRNNDDVLIKVEAISICGTDVRALSDPPEFLFNDGIIIGHEFTGIVEEIGADVTKVKIGDKVVVHPNIWCGKCDYCITGHTNLCENFLHIGDRIDGGMAEYACVPEKMVYKISKSVPSHIACLAEPLACVLNSTREVPAKTGDTVLVFGAGPIGLIFTMLYKSAGAKVIVSDVSEKRRAFALEIGADHVIDPQTQDLEVEVKKIAKLGVDIAADAVGFLLPQAIKAVRKGGNIVLFGLNDQVNVQLNQVPIVSREIKIHGTVLAKGTFPTAVKILEEKIIPIEKLVYKRLPIQQVKEGIEMMRRGEGAKVIIEMEKPR